MSVRSHRIAHPLSVSAPIGSATWQIGAASHQPRFAVPSRPKWRGRLRGWPKVECLPLTLASLHLAGFALANGRRGCTALRNGWVLGRDGRLYHVLQKLRLTGPGAPSGHNLESNRAHRAGQTETRRRKLSRRDVLSSVGAEGPACNNLGKGRGRMRPALSIRCKGAGPRCRRQASRFRAPFAYRWPLQRNAI
jgi:hypothetical protein